MGAVEGGPPGARADICPHFGSCGGCDAQDMPWADYRAWKRGFAEAALRRAGLKAELAPLVSVPPAARRRARLFAHRQASGLVLGFHARGSHDVIDMTACRVLEPRLFALTGPLRRCFAAFLSPGQSGVADVLALDGALDVVIGAPGGLALEGREGLAAFARDAGITRISYQPLAAAKGRGRGRPRERTRGSAREAPGEAPGETEVVAQFGPVAARFGGIQVPLPPAAFLQATALGEEILVERVVKAVAQGARVADLYCGAGTFTFPLAAGGGGAARRVAAFDGDHALIAALNAAARAAGLGTRVEGSVRNLARRPLRAAELAGFDAVVFDPPRAGAPNQAREIAASGVELAVMVSCDPPTFARDGKVLADAGFTPGPVTPVDQFVWTRHLELVAAFRR